MADESLRLLFANVVQAESETDGGDSLALTQRSRIDGGDVDILAIGAIRKSIENRQGHLGHETAMGGQLGFFDSVICCDLPDVLQGDRAGDFEVGRWGFISHRRLLFEKRSINESSREALQDQLRRQEGQ